MDPCKNGGANRVNDMSAEGTSPVGFKQINPVLCAMHGEPSVLAVVGKRHFRMLCHLESGDWLIRVSVPVLGFSLVEQKESCQTLTPWTHAS